MIDRTMTNQHSEDLILLIGSLDGKMDILLENSRDHQDRIVKLEKDRWRISGIVAGVAATVSWFLHDKAIPFLSLVSH